ncbi:uncharacterized protein LOC126754031 [Bactrocera neohumeralis]|uniref:uncharacterized protein LOC126754031 n=1 Tax=Bactrocera neohumeralis TaxID=98809 RepID=UPI00216659A9|nr:uncharacterized protein LOC126754031 [Bactrocera neohumeralis]
MGYDMCSNRCCNVCLLIELDKQVRGALPSKKPLTTRLQKCSGCQLVLYCSQQHQRLDWPLHREFCRGIRKIMNTYKIKHPFLLSGQPHNIFTMERAILQVKYLLKTNLKRKLEFHEEELTSFPAHCEVCYSFEGLRSCNRCFGTSYCSSQHAAEDLERHKKRCSQLQIYYCPYKVQARIYPDNLLGELGKRVPDLLKTDISGAIEYIFSKKLPAKPTASMENYQTFATVGDFSCIGTILFALQFIDVDTVNAKKFIIFILGATVEQDFWFLQIHTKWFFLQYPNFTRLELYFIGPDVLGAAKRECTFNYKGADRTVLYVSHRMLFQDFAKTNSIKPSIICIFNCGFSEHAPETIEEQKEQSLLGVPGDSCASKDTWSGGILQLIKSHNTPIIFTSLTRVEADLDFCAVKRVALRNGIETRIERIFDVKVNPYRDIRPLRNWQRENDDDIFYRNGYVQGFITHLME